MLNWILLGVSILLIIAGYMWRRNIESKLSSGVPLEKRIKRLRLVSILLIVAGGYLFLTRLLPIIF